jgi:probable phosphoglycerate mutase
METKKIIIIRHGNTFKEGDIVTRIGAGTDLPLVEEERSRNVGKYLLNHSVIPSRIFAAPLKRTMQTAELINNEMGLSLKIIPSSEFTEICYGPDENKTEEQVIDRIGREYYNRIGIKQPSLNDIILQGKRILKDWNTEAVVPIGWEVDSKSIIQNWKSFADKAFSNETILIVTSNGIIRFAPFLLTISYKEFCNKYTVKVKTGSIGIFINETGEWICQQWNMLPNL